MQKPEEDVLGVLCLLLKLELTVSSEAEATDVLQPCPAAFVAAERPYTVPHTQQELFLTDPLPSP